VCVCVCVCVCVVTQSKLLELNNKTSICFGDASRAATQPHYSRHQPCINETVSQQEAVVGGGGALLFVHVQSVCRGHVVIREQKHTSSESLLLNLITTRVE